MSTDPAVELWEAYRVSPTRAHRDQLILHYSPLVKFVAGRVGAGLPSNVEQSDLVSFGIFGLIDAIDKFDLDRGLKFETYAISRIRGAILDELRASDWVPRSVRAKARAVETAFAKLEAKLRRTPTEAELAAELGYTLSALQSLLGQLSTTTRVALDEMLGERGEGTTLADLIPDQGQGPGAQIEMQELRRHLAEAIRGMPERERRVLTLYYFENLTLAQIGQIFGVTESRVSQIHTRAVLQLRSRMQDMELELA
jgi:RNA polymerase sigma factor for flagellar operon FliA